MVNAESAEQKLKAKVYKHWKDIQRQCRSFDVGNTGTISAAEFGGMYTLSMADFFFFTLSFED
jgi:hypothetical protein